MNPTTGCPDLWTLERLVRGQLSRDEAMALAMHLSVCPECRQVLESTAAWKHERTPPVWVPPADHAPETQPWQRGELAGGDDRKEQSASTCGGAPTSLPCPFGRYELLDKLGGGGMGVVYRARQSHPDRLVAIKMIRSGELAGAQEIQRFHVEAQAAARLDHPGIVPVYEAGEHAGQHYFSMAYVPGESLDERLKRSGPLPPRQAAELLHEVALAVHYAHEQGVVHRDIKPGNILLQEHENRATGDAASFVRARVTDFGLAKQLASDSSQTATGEVMGTASYMPPEQALGQWDRVGTSADIYSLGATLYAALTGRPPFSGASRVETLRQVVEQEPVRLRQWNASIPRDLETICLKCLEKDPARRYATAHDLAEDLARFLRGEPTIARPISSPQRGWRWCRRNPLSAALIGLTSLALGVAIVSLVVSNLRTEAARRRSDEGFQEAMSAVNDFFTRVSQERLLNEPGLQDVRRDLLMRAKDYYLRFLERGVRDPKLGAELAQTHLRIGEIVDELESPAAALPWLEKARSLQEAYDKAHPDAQSETVRLGTISALGSVYARLDRLDDAAEAYRQMLDETRQSIERTRNTDERFELTRRHANAHMNLGLVEKQRKNSELARQLFEDAQKLRSDAISHKPEDRSMKRDLGKGYYNLANLAIDRNDEAALRDNVTKAIERLQEVTLEDPRDQQDQYLLGLCYRLRADLHAALMARDPQESTDAQADFAAAISIMQRLAELNPAVSKYTHELASLHTNLGQFHASLQDNATALTHLRKAVELCQSRPSTSQSPKSVQLQKTLQEMIPRLEKQQELGAPLEEPSDTYAAAVGFYKQKKWDLAEESFKRLLAGDPPPDRVPTARLYLGLSLMSSKKHQEARTVMREFLKEFPNNGYAPQAMFRVAEASYFLEDFPSAETEFQAFLAKSPEDSLREYALHYVGDTLLRLGKAEAAAAQFQQAIELYPQSSMLEHLRWGLARSLDAQRKFAESDVLYREIAANKTGVRAADAQLQIANRLFEQKKFADAAKEFLEVERNFPDSKHIATARLNAGFAYYEAKDYQAAAAQFELAAQAAEHAAVAAYWRGLAQKQLGDLAGAAATLQETFAAHAEHPLAEQVLFQWADCELRLSQFESAEAHFADVAKRWPQGQWADDALYFAGESALQRADRATTPQARTEALAVAEGYAKQFTATQPNSGLKLYNDLLRGRVLLSRGSDADAAAAADLIKGVLAAAQHPQTQSQARYHLARAQQRLEQHAAVLETFTPVVDQVRKDGAASELLDGLVFFARSALSEKKDAEAVAAAADYIRLAPKGKQINEARAILKQVVDDPNVAPTESAAKAQWMIAESYYLQDDYKSALEHYRRVYLHYKYPAWQASALFQAGACDERLGERAKAVTDYESVISEFPRTEWAEKARLRLEVVRQNASK